MKGLIIRFFVSLSLLTTYSNYPQILLINNNYIQSNQQVKIVDNVYNEKENYFEINLSIPSIQELENSDKQNDINSKIALDTNIRVDNFKNISNEYYKNMPPPYMPFQFFSKYFVTNKSEIISFYIDYYQFTGGAHGITDRIAYNINSFTGEEIRLKDLFTEETDYKSIIDQEIQRQISKSPEGFFTGKDGFLGIKEGQKFYIKDNKIVIYFDLYEIAPYAMGIPEFTIESNIFGIKEY